MQFRTTRDTAYIDACEFSFTLHCASFGFQLRSRNIFSCIKSTTLYLNVWRVFRYNLYTLRAVPVVSINLN